MIHSLSRVHEDSYLLKIHLVENSNNRNSSFSLALQAFYSNPFDAGKLVHKNLITCPLQNVYILKLHQPITVI